MRSKFTHVMKRQYARDPGHTKSLNALVKNRLVQLLVLLSIQVFSLQAIAQVAPLPATRVFAGDAPSKFNIDGYLKRQNSAGDWLAGETLSGSNILDSNSGASIRSLGYHIFDSYTSSDKIFDGSNRATDAISAWKWKTGAATTKANINHALCFVAKDDAGETWGMFSADRESPSGTTSVDFEFLQAKLERTNPLGTSGKFTGSRTVGDLIVTVQFTGNSSTPAAILFYRWSGTTYVLFTPSSDEGFAVTNNNFGIRVPYQAFGLKTYASNQFIEGAINISKLITRSSNNDPCIGYDFRTLLVKSKTTSDISGNLEDFAEPIQFNPELSINSATISYNSPFCQDLSGTANWQSVTFGQNSITTGTFSSTPSGLVMNSQGSVDIANSAPGTYTVNFTYNRSTACSGTAIANAEVIIKPQLAVPTFSATPAGCGTSGGVSINNFVNGATYTLSQNGTPIYTTATSSFGTVAAGDYVLTVSKSGSCSASTNVHVGNNSDLNVDQITGTTSVCVGATATLQDATANGVWSTADAGIATVDPSTGVVTGVSAGQVNITYTVTVGNCSNFAVTAVTINDLPHAEAGSALPAICMGQTSAQLGGSVSGSATGGTWSDGGIGGTFLPNATTLDANWAPPGDFTGLATLTLTTSGGSCTAASDFTTIQVNALPNKPTISGDATVCEGSSIILTSSSATSYQWYKDGNLIDGANSQTLTVTEAGDYTVEGTNSSNCSARSDAHTVTVTPTIGKPVFTAGVTTVCQDAANETYTATSANNGVVSYSVSPAGAGTIDAATGEMNWDAAFSGQATITASAAGCGGPKTETRVVTVTPTVTINPFSPTTSSRCQGAANVSYSTTANNSTSITYSLDAASVTAGNSINSATGQVTYAATWSGTTTITATAAGCNGPATTTHVVTVNPTFCVSYTGDLFKNTDDPAGGSAIVNLVIEVTKSPLNSPAALNPGVFSLQVESTTIESDKITVVTSPDGTKITYSTPYTVSLSSTNLSQSLTVRWSFSNTCEASPSCVETSAVVTVSAPANDFVTGGGYIIPTNSVFNRPVLNGVNNADGYKNNFGFNIKWNKTLKNLTGNWNTIIRRMEGSTVHSYQVKAKPNTLVVTQYAPGKYRADMVFTSVNFQDLTTGNWSDGGGKSSVNVTVIDNGEPGSMVDQVYILIKDKNGNTFYSSSTTANIKSGFESTIPLLNKGNIQVHTIGGVKTNTLRAIDPSVTEVQPFNIRALPNPSASSFNLQLTSSNKVDKMSVRVTDITGRTVQVLHDLAPNQTLNIGAGYRPGLYMVELIQGNERKQSKLVKL